MAPTYATNIPIIKANTDGTWSNTTVSGYKISTEADWNTIVGNPSTYQSATIVLTDNIVFTASHTPSAFSNANNCLQGTLYGNGYSFVNFKQTSSGSYPYGLILFAGKGGVLNGVQLTSAYIDGNSNGVGGLVGVSMSGTLKMIGCTVSYSKICQESTVYRGLGGLLGWVNNGGSVEILGSQSLYNDIVGVSFTKGVGGMVGDAEYGSLTIKNSKVKFCKILGGMSIGGMVGYLRGSSSSIIPVNIYNSEVSETYIYAKNFCVGGIIGEVEYGSAVLDGLSVINCTLHQQSYGSNVDSAGGIIGCHDRSTSSTVVRFGANPSRVDNCWIYGQYSSWAGAGAIFGGSVYIASTYVSFTSQPTHTRTYTSFSSSGCLVEGLNSNAIDYGSYSAPTVGSTYGSIIDREGWTAGNQYGYNASRASTMYSVTTDVFGEGTLTANRPSFYLSETVYLTPSTTPMSWSTTPSGISIVNNKFTMPAQNTMVIANFSNATVAWVYNGTQWVSGVVSVYDGTQWR